VKELPPPTAVQLLPQLLDTRAKLLSDDAAVDALIDKLYVGEQLTDEQHAVTRQHLRAIMGNDKYVGHVAKTMESVKKAELGSKDSMSVIVNSVIKLQAQGLNRLPTQTKVDFVLYLGEVMRSVSPSTCKALLQGGLGAMEASAVETHYLLSLPVERLRATMNVYRDAVLAELNGYPDKPVITEEEARLAAAAYSVAVRKRMAAKLDTETIAYYSKERMNGDPAAVCQVLVTAFEAVVDMDEPFKSWQLTRLVDSMK
jgi:hypothetical protein